MNWNYIETTGSHKTSAKVYISRQRLLRTPEQDWHFVTDKAAGPLELSSGRGKKSLELFNIENLAPRDPRSSDSTPLLIVYSVQKVSQAK